MSQIPTTMKAALAQGPKDDRLIKVASIPVPKPTSKQLLIKTVAFAVNPTDWKHIKYGLALVGGILGSDVSGIVEWVGEDASGGFKVGDYVSSVMRGCYYEGRGAFAEYAIVDPGTTIRYDQKSISQKALPVGTTEALKIDTFEGAASVTLGLGTVALSLGHNLGVGYDKTINKSRAILIWSGATATGVLAIQVAKLVFGLKVYTTASPQNHAFLKSIGADETFDYKDEKVVEKIKASANGLIYYALDTVSTPETFQATYDASEGADEVVLDNLLMLGEKDITIKPGRKVTITNTLAYVINGEDVKFGAAVVKSSPALMKDYNFFWQQVLPNLIGQLKTSNLHVLKPGLESAEEALQLSMNGQTRACKVVWRL